MKASEQFWFNRNIRDLNEFILRLPTSFDILDWFEFLW